MLIYSNYLPLAPGAEPKALSAVLRWLQSKYPRHGLTPADVAPSSRGLKQFAHGEYLEVLADGGAPDSPELWLMRLVHPDREVSGRSWRTEIGLGRGEARGSRALSIALSVEDKSPLVRGKFIPSRPGVVEQLAVSGALRADTPGLAVRTIDSEDAARGFGFECDDPKRRHLILLASPDPLTKKFVIDPEQLRSLVLGLADVVQISPLLDPYLLTKTLGNRYSSWNGAIAFLYPARMEGAALGPWQNVPILSERLRDALSKGEEPARTVVLPRVVHWANFRLGSKIISSDMLGEAKARRRLDEARREIEQNKMDAAAAQALVEQAAEREDELVEKRKALAERDAEVRRLSDELEEARFELEAQKQEFVVALAEATRAVPRPATLGLETFRLARGFLEGRPKLRITLELLREGFGDRVAVLESALESADDVDKIDRNTVLSAFDLLVILCSSYYEALVAGKGDTEGSKLFGAGRFASKENDLGAKGRRLRTFQYNGQDILMETHLKIGVSDSPNTCWRCHFHWDPENRRVVIGHCGKHLDFR